MPAFPKQNPTETDPVASPAVSAHAALTTSAHGGIVASDDARLTNARTPTAHKTTHATGQSDAIAPSDIGAATAAAAAAAQSTADGAVVLAGSKSRPILPWATATAYLRGEAVTNGGHTYTANDAHTSGATFAGDLATHWTLLPVTAADVGAAAATHASQHKTGGTDAIKLDELAAPTDVTTLNADTSKHGLLPKLDGSTSKYLRADGSWQTITVPDAQWHVPISLQGVPSTTTGTWVLVPNLGNNNASRFFNSTAAQNDLVGWDVVLGAGTWSVSLTHEKQSYGPIATILFDGVSVGTIDTYASAASSNNISTVSGIAVAATGKVRVALKAATKHASSSGYYLELQSVTLQRTA